MFSSTVQSSKVTSVVLRKLQMDEMQVMLCKSIKQTNMLCKHCSYFTVQGPTGSVALHNCATHV